MTVTEGLRERKKAETRAALQAAALRLADQHGPDGVTVEAVAEAVGVSARTFFNYFPSKEAAILGTDSADSAPLLDDLKARPEDEAPLDALRAAFHGSATRLEQDPGRWVVRRRLVQRYPELATRWATHLAGFERELVVEMARRTGLDADRDTYPAALVGAVMAAVRVAMTVWQAEDDDRRPLTELIDEVFDQLAAGFPRA
jgi:AcrR family transcriptional regulator